MKKVVSMLAIAAFLFTVNAHAQEPVQKKKKAKTEKSCSEAEKKSCDKDKKGGCCSGKKMEGKKEEESK
jgi:hypothetical protein